MNTKVIAFLALVTIVGCNDVIVGLKTDGRKFFDEVRQANPALWRQMDNVTITAPDNEVIRRLVITDLRPEKDGDVKVVDGGEGHNNVTIELKSPTVLRGYDFHIEVYSSPGEFPVESDQHSTTEIVQNEDKTTASSNVAIDSTTTIPDQLADKNVPAILTKDEEIKDGDREGRSTMIEHNISTERTTEAASTTLKDDISATSTTEHSESTTENHNESSDVKSESNIPAIPSNKMFNSGIKPIPSLSGKDIANDNVNFNEKDETRHERDVESDTSMKPTDGKIYSTSKSDQFHSTTENDKETTTTEISDVKPVENRKYTSFIPSKVEHSVIPIEVKNEKLRNARDANDENKTDENESTTTLSYEITTEFDASTVTSDDCLTTEAENAQNPVNIGKDEGKTDAAPLYVNNRPWNQQFNNPAFQMGESVQADQRSPDDFKVYPTIIKNDQSTNVPEMDAERIRNAYKPSPDHMGNKNPKISAIAGIQDKNKTPVISTQ